MSLSSEAVAGICAGYIYFTSRKRKQKRWWVRELLQNGIEHSSNLLRDLKLNDGAGFKNFVRMTPTDFEILIQMIGPNICKQDTKYRAAIPVALRLAITLRYLASGDSYTSLMYTFRISKQSISEIVPIVCNAIITLLKPYIKMPTKEEEWIVISEGFNNRWNFPHCVGAMDGKHVQIVAPAHSGSLYFNCKKTHSIVMFVIADENYNVLYADVGCQGRISDGGVLKFTTFYKKLSEERLRLPPNQPLLGRNKPMPFIFAADDAFALTTNIMKPYPGQLPGSNNPKRIYNYRHSRARRIIENVFGILSSKFRVFLKPIALDPNKAELVSLTCLYLHNFLRRNVECINTYFPPGTFDIEDLDSNIINPGSWRQDVQGDQLFGLQNIARKSPVTAQEIRDEFKEYFVSPQGSVPWQNLSA